MCSRLLGDCGNSARSVEIMHAKTSITLIVCTRLAQNFRRKCTKSGRFMELKRHNKNGKKYNINKDFRGGERRLYRHPWVSQQDGE